MIRCWARKPGLRPAVNHVGTELENEVRLLSLFSSAPGRAEVDISPERADAGHSGTVFTSDSHRSDIELQAHSESSSSHSETVGASGQGGLPGRATPVVPPPGDDLHETLSYMILHNILFRQRMLMTTQYTMEGPVYSSTRIVQMTVRGDGRT